MRPDHYLEFGARQGIIVVLEDSFDPIVSTQQDGIPEGAARLSNASSAVTCLARLLGRLAAKAHADDHRPKHAKETEHE
jgi:hypothetical protein